MRDRLRALVRSLALSLPPIRRLYAERSRLHTRLSELESERARWAAIEQQYSQLIRWGTPCYDADYLCVWNKNMDFMSDESFLRAYRSGIESGHKLAGDGGSQDIHIEWRILVCCWAAWHARQLEGDFVECGTNTGIMSLAVCNYIDFNRVGKKFYLFDTFRGIPEEQALPDERQHAIEQNVYYEECYGVAKRNFSAFPDAVLVKGKVPDTLATQPIEKVCYLMLDMNITVPERAALEYFWDRLVPGGIVLFDDYGWEGYRAQKDAHDAFADSRGVRILNLPTGQGLLLKP